MDKLNCNAVAKPIFITYLLVTKTMFSCQNTNREALRWGLLRREQKVQEIDTTMMTEEQLPVTKKSSGIYTKGL